jgi:hypothetical protein
MGMSDLTDETLDAMAGCAREGQCGSMGVLSILDMIAEIQRHRAAMRRIKTWRDWLCESPGSTNDKIGQHVTALLRGEP